MRIATKSEMYEKLCSGAFGNTARSWTSYQELIASGYRGLVGVRSLVPGGPFLAHVAFSDVCEMPAIYSEMQNDSHILLQGEVCRMVDGLYLYASRLKTHMRPALRDGGEHHHRLAAKIALHRALLPSDYDALMELLDTYLDSVVEFSAYDRFVGIIPYRNTIIWEVRNY